MINTIKSAVNNQWESIVSSLTGCDRSIFNGKHQPCPICGGKDRFRWDRREQFYICNQCSSGDGIELVTQMLNVDKSTSINLFKAHLGITDNALSPIDYAVERHKRILAVLPKLTKNALTTGYELMINGTNIIAPIVRPMRIPRSGEHLEHLFVDTIEIDYFSKTMRFKSDARDFKPTETEPLYLAEPSPTRDVMKYYGVTVIGENLGKFVYLVDDYLDAIKVNQLTNCQVWCVHYSMMHLPLFLNDALAGGHIRIACNVSYDELDNASILNAQVIIPEVEDRIQASSAMMKKVFNAEKLFDSIEWKYRTV